MATQSIFNCVIRKLIAIDIQYTRDAYCQLISHQITIYLWVVLIEIFTNHNAKRVRLAYAIETAITDDHWNKILHLLYSKSQLQVEVPSQIQMSQHKHTLRWQIQLRHLDLRRSVKLTHKRFSEPRLHFISSSFSYTGSRKTIIITEYNLEINLRIV